MAINRQTDRQAGIDQGQLCQTNRLADRQTDRHILRVAPCTQSDVDTPFQSPLPGLPRVSPTQRPRPSRPSLRCSWPGAQLHHVADLAVSTLRLPSCCPSSSALSSQGGSSRLCQSITKSGGDVTLWSPTRGSYPSPLAAPERMTHPGGGAPTLGTLRSPPPQAVHTWTPCFQVQLLLPRWSFPGD